VSKGLNLFPNADCQLRNSWVVFDAGKLQSNAIDRDPQGPSPAPIISFFDPYDANPANRMVTELISDRNWGLVGGANCPSNPTAPVQKSQAYAVWLYFPRFTYSAKDTQGEPKNMPTLASAHYQIYREPRGNDQYREHMGHTEIVYYTNLYSRIRWEAWVTPKVGESGLQRVG
jgi:hypothetical protein